MSNRLFVPKHVLWTYDFNTMYPCTIWTIVEFGHKFGHGNLRVLWFDTHTPLFENARLEDEISDRMQDG
jgi:hypothetical protein